MLLIFSIAATVGLAASQAPLGLGTVEVDLLFPRHNETYTPSLFFPIVLAVQNTPLGWPNLLEVGVLIYHANRTAAWLSADEFVLPGPDLLSEPTHGNAASDPVIWAHGTSVINGSAEDWILQWTFMVGKTCTDGNRGHFDSGQRTIAFSTAPHGKAPDIAAAVNACSSTSNVTVVLNEIRGPHGNRCIIPNNTYPVANPCALRPLAQNISANVSKAMLDQSGCNAGASRAWQNVTECCSGATSWHGVDGRVGGVLIIGIGVLCLVFLL
ncbi:hypothetical protein SPI_06498 [Niveomyces insectorum RCEF 264]|uniref:DUF7136 domain-containing protein n=1 Tax=Niveomyces insectorum RCEF 264 TaxID=1081102 RepID=A0A167RAX8_9HYPO|nr:hypothetical protein SPI_06498 [Niveomyces insectorum RCEF 264]